MKKSEVEDAIRSHRIIAWTQAKDPTIHCGQVASVEFHGKFPQGEASGRPATIKGVPVPELETHSTVKDAIAVFPAEVGDSGEPIIDREHITLIRARDIRAITSFAGRHTLGGR